MKKYLLPLLLLAGCATSPHEVTDVKVYDKLEIHSGMYKSCTLFVRAIETVQFNPHVGFSANEEVCGAIACESKDAFPVLEPVTCLPFEAVKAEPVDHSLIERGSRNRN